MAQMSNTQTVAVQLEKVRKKLPLLYERDNILLTMLQQRGDVESVSTRSMRLPLQIRPGGKAGQVSMDGGDLGRGSGSKKEVATVTPIYFKFAVEITKLVEYASDTGEKAIENSAKAEIKNGMAQFKSFLDKYLQTSGNCVLATIKTKNTNTNWTLDDPHKAQLLFYNQTIGVYDSTLATKRTGDAEITSIDYETGIIDVDAMPVGTVITDVIVVEGVSGATPTGLFGLKYHQSDAATGLWLALNRATYPEIRTPSVNAANSALAPSHVRLALNKIRKALGTAETAKVLAYMNLDQEAAWEALGVVISQVIKEGADQRFDALFNVKTMGGVPIKASINADPTRIDFLDLSHWGRAVSKEIDYYEVGGNTVFPVYGTSGGLAAAYLFYFVTGFQVWNDSPRRGSYIKALLKPDGY